jgi:hypothetical protein
MIKIAEWSAIGDGNDDGGKFIVERGCEILEQADNSAVTIALCA